ncbi:MAG: GntR family transcriptional regulator [Microbacterium sp.]|nr:MAG: GntR family transcriptional regulator [Microbacterium sp.]
MTPPLSPIDLGGGTILSDEIYTRIGTAILDGTLPAGQRVRDTELAARLGVSRTPVREALQRLERYGLIEVVVGKYTRVTEPSERARRETGEFMAYVMGNALRIAVRRGTDAELAHIVAAMDVAAEAAKHNDHAQLFDACSALFELVTKTTGNHSMVQVIREASFAIIRNLRDWEPYTATPRANADTYVTMRACAAARDADGAERALRTIHGLD